MRVKIKSIKGLLAVLSISILTITSGCTEQGTNLEKISSSSVQENVNKEVSSSRTSASDMDPVSYTHLDVYKRQVEGDVVNGMMQAGQSLTVLQKVEPVATIIEDIPAFS